MTDDGGVWVKIGGNEDTTSPAIVSGGTVTTYVDSGITYQVNTFTSDGTLNVSSAGVADVLVVGGGAAGNGGYGGGAGGYVHQTMYLDAGTHTATIGAGGGVIGGISRLGAVGGGINVVALGGSSVNSFVGNDNVWVGSSAQANAGTPVQGFGTVGGLGGGGAGAASAGSIGGAGVANAITGTSVTYATGGNGSTGPAGGANTGGGGGGNAQLGGSGIVIVRVAI